MSDTILVGVSEAARLMDVDPMTIRRLAQRQEIPVVRIGRRVLFRREDLERWAAEQAAPWQPATEGEGVS